MVLGIVGILIVSLVLLFVLDSVGIPLGKGTAYQVVNQEERPPFECDAAIDKDAGTYKCFRGSIYSCSWRGPFRGGSRWEIKFDNLCSSRECKHDQVAKNTQKKIEELACKHCTVTCNAGNYIKQCDDGKTETKPCSESDVSSGFNLGTWTCTKENPSTCVRCPLLNWWNTPESACQ